MIKASASITGVGTQVLPLPPGTGSVFRVEVDCANASQVVSIRSRSASGEFKAVDSTDAAVRVPTAAAFILPGAVALELTPIDVVTPFTVRVVRVSGADDYGLEAEVAEGRIVSGGSAAAGQGGDSMTAFFAGALTSAVSAFWRPAAAGNFSVLQVWLQQSSNAPAQFSIEDADQTLASISIPAGQLAATVTLPVPLSLSFETPVRARLAIAGGSTGADAFLRLSQG